MRRTGLLVLPALVLAACGLALAGWDAPVDPETVWFDVDGARVTSDVIEVIPGPEHCQWQDTLFMSIDWDRIGIERPPFGGGDLYVYRPDRIDLTGDALTTSFATDADVPTGAADTGYRTDDVQLWVSFGDSPPDGEAIYLVASDGKAQRWPALMGGCA